VIFYINAPIGVLGTIAAAALLRGFPGQANRPFDLPGFASIALSMFALLLALEEGPTWGWTSYSILILFAAGINLLALFVVIELQVAHPMLDVRVFTRWPFVNSLLLISAMSLGMNAVLFYVPAFLQNIQGLSAWHTGLVLLPQALIMMALMPVSGRLYDRFGARWPAIIGLSLTGGGILLLSRINVDIRRPELIAALVVMFAGLALGMMPVMTGGLSALPAQTTDTGSALNTLTQRVSAALGLAVLTALVNVDQAQFFADRAALLPATGANTPPEITMMRHNGRAGLIPLWQQLTNEVTAQAYSNAFFLTGCVTLAGIFLAVLLRTARPTPGAEKPIVH
jgi:MFS family permease